MSQATIYQASLHDIPTLKSISEQTFIETFSEHNSASDMENYIKNSFHTDKLSEELINPCSEFYIAEQNGETAGYQKINFGEAQNEIKNISGVEIERIYVLSKFHGQKIGQALLTKAIHQAMKKSADYIWLGVWERNHKAIQFYQKNGFIEFDKHIFKLGNDEQTDLMMRLDLNKSN